MMTETTVEKLFNISKKHERKIIGLMSGTSLDGLDIAICTFTNIEASAKVKLENFKTVPYTSAVKQEILKVFSKSQVNLQELCILNAWLGRLHGEMIVDCLASWNINASTIDLIASHGQTIFHAPKSFHGILDRPNSTLQIGDGDHIAVTTGIITISDFRQKHVAAGGEGAPLALYGDYFIFSQKGENRIMLNIGGISNITCLFGDLDASKAYATDLGPGNTLIDAITRKHFNKDFDRDGELAGSGTVSRKLLEALKEHEFFSLPFPKTTGPELFNVKYVEDAQSTCGTIDILPTDLIATLTKFTADVILEGISKINDINSFHIYGSGGGIHNPVLMNYLKNNIPTGMKIKLTDELGIPGDAKEAILFAALANEMITDRKTNFGDRVAIPNVSMGKISFPR